MDEVTRGKKRKGRKDSEVFAKTISFGTASPLLSRPTSTVSSFTSEVNGDASEMGDMAESMDGADPSVDDVSKSSGARPHKKAKVLAPLGGRGKMVKKRMSGSRSAAASAGAMAGALAANNAAYAVYGLPACYMPPPVQPGGVAGYPCLAISSPLPTISVTPSSHKDVKELIRDESCNGDY